MKTPNRLNLLWLMACVSMFICPAHQVHAQLCEQLAGAVYGNNFDYLANAGASNPIGFPSAFYFSEAGASASITYAANDGSSATANTYSYGTSTNSDRAFGELTDSSLQSIIGACFVNNSGSAITSVVVRYTGEEWRLGTADLNLDKLDFQYSTNATALNNGNWLDVNTLDFLTPNNAEPTGAKDGNAVENRIVFSPVTINLPVPLAVGSVFFFRWVPTDAAGSDDGLAIDDFYMTTLPARIPAITNVNFQAASGVFRCSGTNSAGFTNIYILATTDLLLPVTNWQVIATNVSGYDGSFIFTNISTNSISRRFLRVDQF